MTRTAIEPAVCGRCDTELLLVPSPSGHTLRVNRAPVHPSLWERGDVVVIVDGIARRPKSWAALESGRTGKPEEQILAELRLYHVWHTPHRCGAPT